jgi:hypothetical protein
LLIDFNSTLAILPPSFSGLFYTFSLKPYQEFVNEYFAGAFAAGTVYQADIRLEAKAGYRFREGADFAYPAGTVTVQPLSDSAPEDRALSRVTYPAARSAKAISDLNLTPYIPKPISGVMPAASFAGPQYTGRVTWKDSGSQAVLAGPFRSDTEYTAEVTLSPAIGYTLSGAGQFTHTGAKTKTLSYSAERGTIGIEFPAAGGEGVAAVYDTDLTRHLPRPIEGLTPAGAVAGNQYTGTVSWTPSHRTFQADTVYTAALNLNAAPGYTFAGIGQNAFTHEAGTAANPAGSGMVTVTFPPAVSSVNPAMSFGPLVREDSALWLMHDKRDYIYSLPIDLPAGNEDIFTAGDAGVILVAGDTSPADVIINGHGRVLTVKTPGALLTVGGGVTLTLRNITFEGINGNSAPLFKVWPGGKLILGEGVTLKDNKAASADAGGVWVNGGELVMNQGAKITGMAARRGGGVLIDAKGKFSMYAGTIGGENSEANRVSGTDAGGGVLAATGSFDMFGGKIQYNEAAAGRSGGGVGVLSGGTFNQSGGEISGNKAQGVNSGGGVYVYEGNLTMNNATPVVEANKVQGANSGGGVYINGGNFVMSRGTIALNTAHGVNSGGGVFIQKNSAQSRMTGGSISENTARAANSGGGIYVGEQGRLQANVSIRENRAKGLNSGGGVYVCGPQSNRGEFSSGTQSNYNAGFIEENFAEQDYSGGGVRVAGYGQVWNWGPIRNNEATGNYSGGGVYTSDGAEFLAAFDSTITGNKALYNSTDAETGGGVYITGGYVESGKTISANTAKGANGVYIAGGTFSMSNYATITGNTGGTNNYGVYVKNTAAGAFKMASGNPSAQVAPDNTVFLCPGATITLSTLANFPPDTVAANIACYPSPTSIENDPGRASQATKFLSYYYNSDYPNHLTDNKDCFRYNSNYFDIMVIPGTGPESSYYFGYYNGTLP